jgi:RimJ/RimL family protein N-acetyltransferase
MRFIVGQDQAVARWVADRIEFVSERGFGNCSAVGIVGKGGEPLAGVVYHDFQPVLRTVQFSIAAASPRWATRWSFKHLLAYPFDELGVAKLWSATPHKEDRILRLVRAVGFTREGVLRKHFGPYGHAVINGMLDSEYRRLYVDPKPRSRPSAGEYDNRTSCAAPAL